MAAFALSFFADHRWSPMTIGIRLCLLMRYTVGSQTVASLVIIHQNRTRVESMERRRLRRPIGRHMCVSDAFNCQRDTHKALSGELHNTSCPGQTLANVNTDCDGSGPCKPGSPDPVQSTDTNIRTYHATTRQNLGAPINLTTWKQYDPRARGWCAGCRDTI